MISSINGLENATKRGGEARFRVKIVAQRKMQDKRARLKKLRFLPRRVSCRRSIHTAGVRAVVDEVH